MCTPLLANCGHPTAPVNVHINSNYSSGSQITFHCGGDSTVMISTCSNGSWIPDPANLDCRPTSKGTDNILLTVRELIITAVVCSAVFFILGSLFGVLCNYWAALLRVCQSKNPSRSRPTPPAATTTVVYEEVSLDPHSERKSDIELEENVAYGPIINTVS